MKYYHHSDGLFAGELRKIADPAGVTLDQACAVIDIISPDFENTFYDQLATDPDIHQQFAVRAGVSIDQARQTLAGYVKLQ